MAITHYISHCKGPCYGPRCYCVENYQRALMDRKDGDKVVFLPNDHPVFSKMPVLGGDSPTGT